MIHTGQNMLQIKVGIKIWQAKVDTQKQESGGNT